MFKETFIILIGAFLALTAFTADLKGKDIVNGGRLASLNGILRIEDEELYLDAEGKTYQIHKGPEWYSEEIGFSKTSGKTASIEGFLMADDISPVTISVEGKIYRFRDSYGLPLWAGRGNLSNHSDSKGYGNLDDSGFSSGRGKMSSCECEDCNCDDCKTHEGLRER
ncbi:unnamed protein product [marine sediment metagenome]|uniref:Uncharacterized protein n=1 Tax=marine sediment metagenome TaxID=412755 RepID=X1HM82_9ZZZZ